MEAAKELMDQMDLSLFSVSELKAAKEKQLAIQQRRLDQQDADNNDWNQKNWRNRAERRARGRAGLKATRPLPSDTVRKERVYEVA